MALTKVTPSEINSSTQQLVAPNVPVISGSAPVYSCRAWVNFNGSNGSINSSGNVSSVIRDAVGTYTITFTTAMPDANYAVNITHLSGGNQPGNSFTTITNNSLVVKTFDATAAVDATTVTVFIIR